MQAVEQPTTASSSGVTVVFGLRTHTARAEAVRGSLGAVLHAGWEFGRDLPAQIVYSYDPLGEHYAAPTLLPAGSITNLQAALDCLESIAPFYNQSISLSFPCERGSIPTTARVYEEFGALLISLDFARSAWMRLVAGSRSLRAATTTLVDAGRTLFTLLPATYLLIGPTRLALDLTRQPRGRPLRALPVTLLPRKLAQGHADLEGAKHIEHLPRGTLIVRQWDAGATVKLRRPSAASSTSKQPTTDRRST